MNTTETDLRNDLATLYRVLAHFGMSDLVYTHISARIPGGTSTFLINRYGTLFHEMNPSDLVKIDIHGNALNDDGTIITNAGQKGQLVNAAGFTIHSAVHSSHHHLNCVVHTHTLAGVAVSAQVEGLRPISQHALRFYGKLSYHDYEGIAFDLRERESLIRDLGSNQAMILRNHGLLVAGRTIAEAFNLIYYLEMACKIQVAAMSGGRPLVEPQYSVCVKTATQFSGAGILDHCEMTWQAAKRLAPPLMPLG